jgi:RND family efflux transporter MFP subunit
MQIRITNPSAWGTAGAIWLSIAILAFASCSRDTAVVNPPTPVRVATVSTSDVTGGIRYSANIVANAQVNLAFKSGGYVETIAERKGADGRVRPLEAGDRVTRGEVLATVRESEYADRATEAKAQVAQAKAAFEKSQVDFQRASHLFSSESLTKSQYDAAKAANDGNAAALENAKASLAQAETTLNDCMLRSPMNGWVVERDIEIGSFASPGSQGFVIADTSMVKAVFGVPDTMIHLLRLGDQQTMTTISVPGEIRGRVTSISPSADPKSRVFSVEVTIPNSGNRLKSGMIATLALTSNKTLQPVMVVPLSAVVRSSRSRDGFAVFVIGDADGSAIARERDVKVGETIGNNIAVTQGLQVGEHVVSVGATEIRDGDPVRVLL